MRETRQEFLKVESGEAKDAGDVKMPHNCSYEGDIVLSLFGEIIYLNVIKSRSSDSTASGALLGAMGISSHIDTPISNNTCDHVEKAILAPEYCSRSQRLYLEDITHWEWERLQKRRRGYHWQ